VGIWSLSFPAIFSFRGLLGLKALDKLMVTKIDM
jgi:hypothetical protein